MSVAPIKKGFSLIELLVTVAIIAVVSGILMVNFSGTRGKARDAQRVSDVSQIQLALQLYYDRCGQYPSSLAISANNGCPTGATLGTYISQIPIPPAGAGQTAYDYATLTSGSVIVNYLIHAVLEQYNAAAAKGLNAMPSGSWSATYTCSTSSTPPINYCVTSN